MALGVHSFKAEVCATYLQSLIDCYIPVCHPLHLLLTRQALTEVSVLSDLLQITQNHRQYLVLDPAAVPQPTGVSPVFQYLAKKKVFASRGCHSNILTWPLWCIQSQALSVAAGILRSGTKTLSKISSKSEREFHKTLLQLRERWKLRRTPTGIVGDLSFCQMEKSMSPWMGTGRCFIGWKGREWRRVFIAALSISFAVWSTQARRSGDWPREHSVYHYSPGAKGKEWGCCLHQRQACKR